MTTEKKSRKEISMRVALTFMAVAAVVIILAGCAAPIVPAAAPAAAPDTAAEPAEQEGPKRKVIFVTHDLNPFFIPAIIGLKDFGEMAGWETEFIGPTIHDTQGTIEYQYNALAAQPDAVGFTAVDSDAFLDPIRQAQEAGIPVVLFNTRAPGVKEETGVAYVGQDFVQAGHIAGYELGKYITEHTGKTEGLVVQPIIAPGHFALETRNSAGTEGLQRYNEEFGTNFTTEALATTTEPDQAMADFEAKWAADGDKIVGWLAADFTHTFVGDWAKKNDLVGQFAVGGYDLLDATMTNIKDGSVDFSIGQNPYGQGFLTAALIFQQLERGYPASDIDTGAELIDASTIDAVIERETLWKEAGQELGFDLETGG
ncbi:MAG: substrate-binding domain-containing protein [Chloroflexota bacterium]|nr:substrate-binding domain-containing protein [Chloroflexota bacterium]